MVSIPTLSSFGLAALTIFLSVYSSSLFFLIMRLILTVFFAALPIVVAKPILDQSSDSQLFASPLSNLGDLGYSEIPALSPDDTVNSDFNSINQVNPTQASSDLPLPLLNDPTTLVSSNAQESPCRDHGKRTIGKLRARNQDICIPRGQDGSIEEEAPDPENESDNLQAPSNNRGSTQRQKHPWIITNTEEERGRMCPRALPYRVCCNGPGYTFFNDVWVVMATCIFCMPLLLASTAISLNQGIDNPALDQCKPMYKNYCCHNWSVSFHLSIQCSLEYLKL